jgi:hypothetical protein
LARAQTDMNVVCKHIGAAYPTSSRKWGASVEKYQNDFLARNVQRAMWIIRERYMNRILRGMVMA